MNIRPALGIATALIFSATSSLSATELHQLRALVAEQERQIRMLEEENSRLRADATSRGNRLAQNSASQAVTNQPSPAPSSTPPAGGSAKGTTYTVVAGDNLVRIGRQFGVTAEAIARANGIGSDMIIRPGQRLSIPTAADSNQGGAPTPTASTGGSTRTYVVAAGDTFYRIAREHQVPVESLMAANPDTAPSSLRVGQTVRIPAAPTAAPAPSSRDNARNATPPAPPASTPAINQTPAPMPVANAAPPEPRPSMDNRRQVSTIRIDGEMSYATFAEAHGTSVERLNQLNGLDLDGRTVLARGSELYVPARP